MVAEQIQGSLGHLTLAPPLTNLTQHHPLGLCLLDYVMGAMWFPLGCVLRLPEEPCKVITHCPVLLK